MRFEKRALIFGGFFRLFPNLFGKTIDTAAKKRYNKIYSVHIIPPDKKREGRQADSSSADALPHQHTPLRVNTQAVLFHIHLSADCTYGVFPFSLYGEGRFFVTAAPFDFTQI